MNKYLIISTIAVISAFAAAMNVSAQNYTFNSDLTVGSSGQDVVNLQSWLIANGYSIPSVSSGATPKGYFGSQTQSAVSAYQRSVGLPAYGYFGSMTRGRISSDSKVFGSDLRVILPNGGETWQKGSTRNITWNGPSAMISQTGDIRLEFAMPACAAATANPRCMIAVRAPLTIATGVNLDSGTYSWVVGNYNPGIVPGYVVEPIVIQDGQYKIQICTTNGSQCDDSDNYFTMSSNGTVTSNTPVINGIDAPTTLTVGQTGTWTIYAKDPQNLALYYRVDWGDSVALPVGWVGNAMEPVAFSQAATLTHVYSIAGTYTPKFTVVNSANQTAVTSATVQVTNSSTAGPLKIISPNGGETWQKGTIQSITWTSPAYFRATNADLKLLAKGPSCTTNGSTSLCPMYMIAPYTIATNIQINQNSYSWIVGNALPFSPLNSSTVVVPDGQYTVQICESGTNNCDTSDAYFAIAPTQTSGVPDINIVSPNGGETWDQGLFHNVQVNVTGDTAKIGNMIYVYLVDSGNRQIFLTSLTNITPGINNISVQPGPAAYAGTYRVFVTLNNNSAMQAYDYSDGYITVTTAPPCPFGYSCAPIVN